MAEEDLAQLQELAGAQQGVVVERYRADFTRLLARCRLSVSQGGYNTVMEILQARAPAVVVPFAGGAETGAVASRALAGGQGWVEMVEESAWMHGRWRWRSTVRHGAGLILRQLWASTGWLPRRRCCPGWLDAERTP